MTEDLTSYAGRVARELSGKRIGDDLVSYVVELAVKEVDGCEAAALSVVQRKSNITTPASSHPSAAHGDKLQYETRQGPCLDAIHHARVISAPDLTTERRWPVWASRMAAESGYRSMMCLRLYTERDTVGALNLYSSRRHAFDDEDRSTAEVLAAMAAVALADARQIENLEAAMENRALVGRAQGMLMERYQLDEPGAFAVLARLSSHTNRKLRDIAAELIATRTLPEDPRASADDPGGPHP